MTRENGNHCGMVELALARITAPQFNTANEGACLMSVARVTEIISSSTTSFEDATQKGVDRAVSTLKNVKSAWVKDQKVTVVDGAITEYRVGLKVTFVLED